MEILLVDDHTGDSTAELAEVGSVGPGHLAVSQHNQGLMLPYTVEYCPWKI